jgi:hypothetical protein
MCFAISDDAILHLLVYHGGRIDKPAQMFHKRGLDTVINITQSLDPYR